MGIENKQAEAEEPIVITISGPNATGKTAILGLIAEVLAHTGGFEKIGVKYPEQNTVELIKEKVAALMAGQMDHVKQRPIVLAETGPLRYEDNVFTGHYRAVPGTTWFQWPTPINLNFHHMRESLQSKPTFGNGVQATDYTLRPHGDS